MTFFNPKEEVLDIQLTQYGRHLLSKGKLKPVYYAFFDEGVLYDSSHAGFEENKSDAEKRIQDETPGLKTRYSFTGREEHLFDGIGDAEDRRELGIYERLYTLPEPLGTSDLSATKSPYFSLSFLEGEIVSSVNHITGNVRDVRCPQPVPSTSYSHQVLKIPQVEVDIEYKVATVDPESPSVKFEVESALSTNRVYANGLSVVVGPEEILLLAEEGNTTCDHKNFDIEVFEMTGLSGSLGEEVMVPLSFVKPLKMIENNILLDPKEARRRSGRKSGERVELDSSYVEYYFDLDIDDEIDKNVVCRSLGKLHKKGRNIYSPCGVDFDCPDLERVIKSDIYGSDADEEVC
jgi:hypothetical protein